MYKEETTGCWVQVMHCEFGTFRAQTNSGFLSRIITQRLERRLTRAEAEADLDEFAKQYSLVKEEQNGA